MSGIGVPFNKIDYVSYSKEIYEDVSYNRMSLELMCSDVLRANLSFYWKADDSVPVELLEFIGTMGVDVDLGGD